MTGSKTVAVLPTRDEYYRICISRGATEEVAASLADGLVDAQARKSADRPGWERVSHKIPPSMRSRCIHLYSVALMSCPSEDIEEQARSGMQAILAYGVFVGMALAESGQILSDAEREASHTSMPDVWDWIERLNADEEKSNRDG